MLTESWLDGSINDGFYWILNVNMMPTVKIV